MKDDIIAGLDISSTSIRLAVGRTIKGPTGDELQIIGAVSVPSEGINKGVVNSIDDLTSSIAECLDLAERRIGVPIRSVNVSLNDFNVKYERSKGIAFDNNVREITQNDVDQAIETAKSFAVPVNYEIIHALPIKFSVDTQSDIQNPIGMSGNRLEVEILIIYGLSIQIENLKQAIHRTGLTVNDFALSPIAAAQVAITNKQEELGVALINLGANTTSIAVYEERKLIHVAILPIGSEHITSDIAIGLRCPINLAERIKKEFGQAVSSEISKKEEVNITEMVREEEINDDISSVPIKYVAEIIEARVDEIFKKVDEEFQKIDHSGALPAGVVLVGGGSELQGIVESAKKNLRLAATIGQVKDVTIAADNAKKPEFLTAIGLAVWGEDDVSSNTYIKEKIKDNLNNFVNKAKGIFGKIMPK